MDLEVDRELTNRIQNDGKVKVLELQDYLRRHDLRIGGKKDELMERIQEHIGSHENQKTYPKSTFVVDCTGDVCKGDVVFFKQDVYEKTLDARSWHGEVAGQREVAGRVISDSYGSECQQHTFTVEVMWSTGKKALRPMQQLLIKGRNLYGNRTRRQLWSDEEARKRILDEKHERGDSARQIRESRTKVKKTVRIVKKQKTALDNKVGRYREPKVADAPPTIGPMHVKKVGRASPVHKLRRRAPEPPKARTLQKSVVARPTAPMCVKAERVRAQQFSGGTKKRKRDKGGSNKNFQKKKASRGPLVGPLQMRKAMVAQPFDSRRWRKFRPWLHRPARRDSSRNHRALDPSF